MTAARVCENRIYATARTEHLGSHRFPPVRAVHLGCAVVGGKRLELGSWGEITTFQRDGTWYARARYRNAAGVTRPVERRAETPKKAAAKLRKDLRAMAEESHA